MRNLLLIIGALLQTFPSTAQEHDTLWHLLSNTPGQPVFVMNHHAYSISGFHDALPPDPIHCVPIKTGNQLDLWVQGTGRVFRIYYDTAAKRYLTERLDATEYVAYNFGALPFSFQNKLYNLGGYGYWEKNSMLRLFNPVLQEWEVVRLNREIPLTLSHFGDLLWVDPKKGKVYLAGYTEVNDGLKSSPTQVNKVMQLDVQSGEWTELGELSDYLQQINASITQLITQSSKGLLWKTTTQKFLFLSFLENKIYLINPKVWEQFSLRNLSHLNNHINFFIDSTLYSYDVSTHKMDHYTFVPADFQDLREPIYTFIPPFSYYLLIFLVPLLAGGWLVYRKYIRQKPIAESNNSEPTLQPVADRVQLEQQELTVLRLLYVNAIKEKTTTIDELNSVLGISKRNFNVQKKLRSDCIQSINYKLDLLLRFPDNVIDKKRSEEDKRSFEYFITPDYLEAVNQLISSQ